MTCGSPVRAWPSRGASADEFVLLGCRFCREKPNISSQEQPIFTPIQGKAAFDTLLLRYEAMSADTLLALNADVGLAAVAALGVAARANAPEMLVRFDSLPASEFDVKMVEELPTMAWAC